MSESTTVMIAAASGLMPMAICGRPRFREVDSAPFAWASTPSAIRSAEIAEMVEWERLVVRAMSVRDGCPGAADRRDHQRAVAPRRSS